jgi:hypothetical protein
VTEQIELDSQLAALMEAVEDVASQIEVQAAEHVRLFAAHMEARGIVSGIRVTYCQSEDGIASPAYEGGLTLFVHGSQYIEITIDDQIPPGHVHWLWRD